MGEGTKRWDKYWNAIFWPLTVSIPVVGGVDARFEGSRVSPALFAVGIAAFATGLAISARAMAANPFFEGTVRIQRDRGHRVVSVGPYRRVRHPATWASSSGRSGHRSSSARGGRSCRRR